MDNQTTQVGLNKSVRRAARLGSILVCAWFTFLLGLVATNEDKPLPQAMPVLIVVALTIIACIAAWRWERAGGLAIIIGAVAIGLAWWLPFSLTELNILMPIFVLTYVVPFGAVGALFVWADWTTRFKTEG